MNQNPILALDVDGVVMHGWPARKWNDNIESDLGVALDSIALLFGETWLNVITGKIPLQGLLEEIIAKENLDVSAQDILDYWFDEAHHIRQDVLDASLIWKERTGGQIVLATNQEALRSDALWRAMRLGETFDTLLVSCELGIAKPHPEFFQKSDARLGRTQDQTVIFLDDLAANVEAADAHGWHAVHVPHIDGAAALIERL